MTVCGTCYGSGYMRGIYGDLRCFDCDGEGSWEDEEPVATPRKPYVPSPEYVAWCAEVDARREQFCEVHGDPLLKRRFG